MIAYRTFILEQEIEQMEAIYCTYKFYYTNKSLFKYRKKQLKFYNGKKKRKKYEKGTMSRRKVGTPSKRFQGD